MEIDGGSLITYSGDLDFSTCSGRWAKSSARRQYDRQQAMLAKELKFIERFKARASHAAQVQSRVKKLDKIEKGRAAAAPPVGAVRVPQPAALGRGRGELQERPQGLWQPADLCRARSSAAPPGTLVRAGRQRRGQIHAAEAGGRRDRAGRGQGDVGRQRQDGLLRPALHGPARRPRTRSSNRSTRRSRRRARVR